jgi:DNA relaxase NicK
VIDFKQEGKYDVIDEAWNRFNVLFEQDQKLEIPNDVLLQSSYFH